MKLHDIGDNRWSYKDLNNDNVTHNKRVVKAPASYLSYEQKILIKKMFNCETYKYRYSFAVKQHAEIYNLIEPFYKTWETVGFDTENFIQYAKECRVLEYCGGANYIRSIFQNMEYEGGIPV